MRSRAVRPDLLDRLDYLAIDTVHGAPQMGALHVRIVDLDITVREVLLMLTFQRAKEQWRRPSTNEGLNDTIGAISILLSAPSSGQTIAQEHGI
jgi:hypothetical protein